MRREQVYPRRYGNLNGYGRIHRPIPQSLVKARLSERDLGRLGRGKGFKLPHQFGALIFVRETDYINAVAKAPQHNTKQALRSRKQENSTGSMCRPQVASLVCCPCPL
jgi:hypothetical protein